ncbi:TPA: hypothetical protein ACQRJB_000008 [Pseudomonas aeruginosa]|uniref:hypothetical protein n=1 Tax=Pseudomonas aeruginosa TaxID=287 RepID=UPI000AF75AE0|nr:hypothetical protein [Pseudomonas aeruginosa]ELL4418539.1 hypothetical protein [Pseudomonas aeruginosa]EMA4491103.1 hypothetical protein [Pseudomonas aeruginosa]EMB2229342.1 hypothetical protein [Pseudomonas aeruginosa]EME9723484.1 hypothetical protein [Pseudomonas aeruginosa]MCT0747193.1 hypothetical protein [Pseudomonas aeruginosa]
MSIDWSKAPEGCIGAFARIISKTAFFVFSKRPSDYMSREGYEGEGEDGPYHVFSEYWEWIDKPWDGQGLPPVGTVCEVKHRDIGWVRCEIVAHKSFSCGGLTHAIAWIDENTLDQSQGLRFRQLRTPEQIAAEEREKAVGDMAMSIQGVPYQYPTLYALYDAGYRRQESST